VYGSLSSSDPAFTETTPYDPSSPYSASKAASDHLVRAYHRTYGLQVTLSNCSNNYGPFHYPEKLIPLALISVLEGKPVPVYGDGGNIRDWLFVDDHCAGIEAILTRGTVGETYNIGGINERTNIEVVTTLCAALDRAFESDSSLRSRFPQSPAGTAAGARSLIRFVKDRPGHDWRYAIDPRKLNERLGYAPHYDFDTGIATTVAWFLAHESWWRDVMDKDYQAWSQLNYASR
jgi:dTDP-glucose 4,6-dehydratase